MASTSKSRKHIKEESRKPELDNRIDLFLELKMDFSHLDKPSPTQLMEDLLTMMKYNYPNKKSFSTLSMIGFCDLKDFCAHGIVYGAIQTTCLTCGGILCPFAMDPIEDKNYMYRCLNQTRLRLCCRNDLYYKVLFSDWKIPIDNKFQHPNVKQVIHKIMKKRRNENSIHPPVNYVVGLNIFRAEGALLCFLEESCVYKEKNYKIYVRREGRVKKRYAYFLINKADLSDGRYSLCQILVPENSESVNSKSDCLFYVNEKIYKDQNKGEKSMKIEDAIKWFEEKFLLNTGIDWLSWCQFCSREGANINRHCFHDDTYMLPLKIDYQHKASILSNLSQETPMYVARMLQY